MQEATELLLEELNRMRDEEGELKKKMKEDKDAMKALKKQQKEAMKAATTMKCDDDDSSESSESSESECEEQMMTMSCVASVTMPQIGEGVAISTTVPQVAASDVATAPAMEYDKAAMKAMKKREKEKKMATLTLCKDEDSTSCSSESSDSECEEVVRMSRCATITTPQTQPSSTVFPIILPQIPESVTLEPCQDAQISSEPANTMLSTTATIAVVEKPMTNRIEVCMGGKCKKSGSLTVLQEFEKKVGTDGAVVGCKCLGKCGLGPNVRLRSEGAAQKKNPLFIGVVLEDVGTIASGLFGGGDDLGMVNN
jgi:(2Fe-2S) ferredoxin